MSNRCYKCRATAHSSKIILDKRLKPYYSMGLCVNCYPLVIQESTINCVECQSAFIKNSGWPQNMCPQCRISDVELQSKVVYSALSRKVDRIALKALSVEDWIATLNHFNGLCAYCQVCAFECLEHFVPITLGGGTCIDNVVPSCLPCNSLKKNLHPSLVTSIPQKDIERVRSYLLSI